MLNILWLVNEGYDDKWFSNVFKELSYEIDINTEYNQQHDVVIMDQVSDIDLICQQNKQAIIILVVNKQEEIYHFQHINIRYYIRKESLLNDLEVAFKKFHDEILDKVQLISLKKGMIEYKIRKYNILYIEYYRNDLIIHTKDFTYTIRSTLKQIKTKLDSSFVQCHKSYLVNIHNIALYHVNEIYFEDNICIPIGKKYQKEFHQYYQIFIDKTSSI